MRNARAGTCPESVKIAPFRYGFLGARQGRLLSEQSNQCIAGAWVATADNRLRGGILRQVTQQRRQILDLFCHHMNYTLGILQLTSDADQPRAEHNGAKSFEYLRPNDDIDYAGFVFQLCENDALGGAGALGHADPAADPHAPRGSAARQ